MYQAIRTFTGELIFQLTNKLVYGNNHSDRKLVIDCLNIKMNKEDNVKLNMYLLETLEEMLRQNNHYMEVNNDGIQIKEVQ